MQLKARLAAITFLITVVFIPARVVKAQSGICAWGDAAHTWVADFNLDGKADIVTANGANVSAYLSTGYDFTFTSSWKIPDTWGAPAYTWVADFNGDGKPDIASAVDANVYMHLSTGTGFNNVTWPITNTWNTSGQNWVADFNGDGMADIASKDGDNIIVNLSTGIGFNNLTWPAPGMRKQIWIGYFDDDKLADIATADDGNTVQMFLSTGAGFLSRTWGVRGAWNKSGYIWVADFNGDGRSDLASKTANGRSVYVYLSTGTGFRSDTWATENADDKWGDLNVTWAADFNGDGKADLASAKAGVVRMHLSTGSAFDNKLWLVPDKWGAPGFTWAADFNGDGKADIASAQECTIHMRLSTDQRLAVEDWFATIPPLFQTYYVRRNVYSLDPTAILLIAAGVRAMKSRPASDPTSWEYQSRMHGIAMTNGLPKAIGPQANCQHGQFFFLAWHRMFIYYFERILRKASGDPTLTLPYWNYSDVPEQAVMPPAWRDPASPLYDSTRNPIYNAGTALTPETVRYDRAFGRQNFTTSLSTQASFGGITFWAPAHFPTDADSVSPVPGLLELSPHNTVHAAIGGQNGNMGGPQSPLDPIFWLHHANIDRLWNRWLALGNGRIDPISSSGWMNQEFFFFDENGTRVSLTGAQILDSFTQLNYRYDDEEPQKSTNLLAGELQQAQQNVIASEVLATRKQSTKLTAKRVQVKLDFPQEKKQSLSQSLQNKFRNEEVVLQIKGLQYDAPVGLNYVVYLNLPDSARTREDAAPYFVGTIGFFGNTHSHAGDHHEMPAGFTANFDITELLLRLKDTDNFRLTIVPDYPKAPPGRADVQRMIDAMKPKGNPRFDEVVMIKHRFQ
jgi:hypothetical protein